MHLKLSFRAVVLFFILLSFPHQVFANFAYVINSGSITISVINTQTNELADHITIENAPQGVVFTPNTAYACIGNNATTYSVTAFDSTSNISSLLRETIN